jgi:hypothetical protein
MGGLQVLGEVDLDNSSAKASPNDGLIEKGNIDLYNRPSITNPKGGKSTVYSTSFGDEKGREIR